jgi:hypothetical protein
MKNENLLLTKKSKWEKIISSKLKQYDFTDKQVKFAITGIEVLLPFLILVIIGSLVVPKDK